MTKLLLPVRACKRVVIAYGFRRDFSSFRNHIHTHLPEISQIGFDLVVILSSDNINYELFVNNQARGSFEINPRFLEFEALQVALSAVLADYDTYIYFNCSLFSKHILSSARKAIAECLDNVESASCPCLSGRTDYFTIREYETNIPVLRQFISTFFLIFNKSGAELIKNLLDDYPRILNSSKKYDFDELEKSIVYRLSYCNKNYLNSPESLIFLKAGSVLVEKLISIHMYECGRLVPAGSLNSNTIRILEFGKNFIYKRIPCARSYLSRF